MLLGSVALSVCLSCWVCEGVQPPEHRWFILQATVIIFCLLHAL